MFQSQLNQVKFNNDKIPAIFIEYIRGVPEVEVKWISSKNQGHILPCENKKKKSMPPS